MSSVNAFFYDGQTSNRHHVRLELSFDNQLLVTGSDFERMYALSDIKVLPRIGNIPRSLYLSDGGKCEITEHEAFDQFLAKHKIGEFSRKLHRVESKFYYALGALILTIVIGWVAINDGVPALAKEVAFNISPEADKKLGEEALETLDKYIFSESDLPEDRQKQLKTGFTSMTKDLKDGHDYQLEFRSSENIGPNAFALPSGIIVLTDDLVELAENDEEIMAVIAHEIGHVVNRHTLRHVLQNTVTGLVVAVSTGDIFSASATAAALPTIALHAKYSRNFEREADLYALEYLKRKNISLKRFSSILQRMQDWYGDNDKIPTFISSHPPTLERVQAFEK